MQSSKIQSIIQEREKIDKKEKELEKDRLKDNKDKDKDNKEKDKDKDKDNKIEYELERIEQQPVRSDTDEDLKGKIQNGQSVPPKPLPRSSRANSISEEEPKPVARPRTSPSTGSVVTSVNPNMVGGYKVRRKRHS